MVTRLGVGKGGLGAQSRPGELGNCESAKLKCTALKGEGGGLGGQSGGREEGNNVDLTKLKLNQKGVDCNQVNFEKSKLEHFERSFH